MSLQAPHAAPSMPREWDAPADGYPARDRWALHALIWVPAVLVALVVAVFTGLWWLGGVLLLLWAVKTFAEARWTDRVMLRRLGAGPLDPHDAPRLENLVAGIAADLGVEPPRLLLLPEGGPNALVASGGKSGLLAVRKTLLDTFTRTELEAVVAHCLLRLHSKEFTYSNLAARWSDLGAGLAPQVGTRDDVRAAAFTRYPPALAAAIGKCDAKVLRYTPLWFVADAPSHMPARQRLEVLEDL